MIDYKGFKITVHAGKHPIRDEWKPSASVIIPHGEKTEVKTFPVLGDSLYPTREAAIQEGYEIIKRLINSGDI